MLDVISRFSLYKISDDTLGAGAYGQVFSCVRISDGVVFAAKKFSACGNYSHTVLREIKLLQEIDHPNVIKVVDVVATRFNIFLILEKMDGSLGDFCCGGKLSSIKPSLQQLKGIASQLVTVIDYIHDLGIVHRDVKPQNILYKKNAKDGSFEIKLCDFGIARKVADCMTPRMVTTRYRPPELFDDNTSYDTAVDVWSTGIVIAEMFTNFTSIMPSDIVNTLNTCSDPLHVEDAIREMIALIVVQLPKYLQQVTLLSKPYQSLILRMLDIDPETRVTAKEALIILNPLL
jgi:CTD kinase subunit alpha